MKYGPDGNLIEETDANGKTTTYTYDRMNRLKQAISADGAITAYGYDPSGNLVKLTDPDGKATAYNYAGCGMLIEEIDPSGYTTSYRYDGNKNLAQKIDANGKTTAYTHDLANQLKAVTYPDGTNLSFNYDNGGNITFAQSSIARLQQTFDALNRLTKADYLNIGKAVNYQYDRKGRRDQTHSAQWNLSHLHIQQERPPLQTYTAQTAKTPPLTMTQTERDCKDSFQTT